VELVPVDLVEIVRVTLEQMGLLAEEKQIFLRFEPGEATYVTGDPMRLKQIAVNLVDNAIKYTPVGGNVSVSVTTEDIKAVLRVSDTGIGIPAAALPLVFDRFYRADDGGVASVESMEGKGTTFRVELPLPLHVP